MTARVCLACTTVFTVGAPACPHCRSTDHVEQGDEAMPKITRHGGPSHAAELRPEQPQPVDAPAADVEGGAPSAGSSTAPSSPKPSKSSATSKPARPSRARTTANPSNPTPTAGSTAGSTATPGRKAR